MVIVILGTLTAVAIPKFVNLGTQANQAALVGVVGVVESASEIQDAAAVTGNPYAASTAGASCAFILAGTVTRHATRTAAWAPPFAAKVS